MQTSESGRRQAEREFDTVISHTWWFEWGKVASKKISKIRHELFSTFNHNARAMLCARDDSTRRLALRNRGELKGLQILLSYSQA